MTTDKLTSLEKLTLALLGAGNAFNVLMFGLGLTLEQVTPAAGALWGWRVVFTWFNFLAFDLAAVVTIMSFRDGRRGFWAELAAVVAMLAGILIAIEVAYPNAGMDWLHAAPIVVLYCFGRHLATPRQRAKNEAPRGLPARTEMPAPVLVHARIDDAPMPIAHDAPKASRTATKPPLACPACSATLSTGEYGAAKRWGTCKHCKEV